VSALDDLDRTWVDRILATGPTVGPVHLVCVDGPAGAGKTTLADSMAATLSPQLGPVPVVHGDELYEGWDVVVGANDRVAAFGLLPPRIVRWLLEPWARGHDGVHPTWDWYAGAWGDDIAVPAARAVVLEGVGLAAASLRRRAALSVWVDADPVLRLERVLERDGEALRPQMESWQHDEARWHELDRTRDGVDLRLST
jgi:uridine kinase